MRLEEIVDIIHKPVSRIDQEELFEGIGKIEGFGGVTLPQDFRSFLAAYGRPFFTTPSLEIYSLDRNELFDLATFFGISYDTHDDILRYMKSFEGRFPDKCIPIGDD
ncbi:SMI1/KNR4 family protein [bacterium]|nr:SMI1/KNR4 family protein [bacterium]